MYKHFFKRLLDIIFSILGLFILLIIIIPISIMIYIDDKGPIFFKSKRIGENGKLFEIYKFRSMYINSPDIRLKSGSTYNGNDDPRTTKVGKLLRMTSLDELPQFFNVLKGNMSIIGPRPDTPDWLEKYPNYIRYFLTVKPGITGLNQAYYRNSSSDNLKMVNDLYYARNISFLLDINILFKTIICIIGRKNINRLDNQDKKINDFYEIGSEYYYNHYSLESDIKNFKDHYFYRSGRDIYKLISKNYKNKYNKIFMPALSCPSMYSTFLNEGYDVEFYELNNNYKVNYKLINKLNDGSIIVFKDFFKTCSFTSRQLKKIKSKNKNIIVIRDVTQNIVKLKENNQLIDYTIASIRKWGAFGEGAIVNKKIENNNSLTNDDTFFNLKIDAMKIKKKYLQEGNLKSKNVYLEKFKEANDYLDIDENICSINSEAKKLIENVDFDLMLKIRDENSKYLLDHIKVYKNIRLIGKKNHNLYFPILIKNRDEVQKRLSHNNIYCPIIWPTTDVNSDKCKIASLVSNNSLCIPCDQRYKLEDMQYIVEKLLQVMGEIEYEKNNDFRW